jgi:hypothetical protein
MRWAELKAAHLTGRADVPTLSPEFGEHLMLEQQRKYGKYMTNEREMPPETRAVYQNGMEVVRFIPNGNALTWDNSRLPHTSGGSVRV